ncbi:MAG: tetratricopeptide repeat protein [Roseofilum sp. SBFL]|uniref:tetratricopeptide repeat protein n=1 Tax=unclassified Roseofilum TaxID=2620099 RepID=UPI001B17455A|nr:MULTISPECIES: tetratricopeptide repeat protein [unclassified Roseofilum]MBP0015671.1 tetratricopeptide repeat protein [Roseofilum sp. SID3]MBP0022812.1 tetratricopeptide repeat protein [Roseofilum sp. SID2]MBP0037795.1 tetratricopeptide repeat protein [Roseofilum sp. SID1]MBP0042885.1 tetratricopeptide repeat protein [Roseofilum sp. SBFL]
MSSIDIHILEERKNLFNLLRSLEEKCLLENEDRERAFSVFMKVWDALTDPLFEYGYWHDFNDFSNVVIRVAQKLNKVPEEAQALNEIGWVNMEWGNFEVAENNFLQALQRYESLKDTQKQCRTLRYLGVLYSQKQQIEMALNYYGNALSIAIEERTKIYREDRDLWNLWTCSEAELHNLLGIYYLNENELASSCRELSLSIDLLGSIDDPSYEYYLTDPLINSGQWYFVQQDHENAKKYYQESIDLSRKINRTDTIARGLLALAKVAEAEGDKIEAIELATQAERAAGIEIPLTREEAACFKEKILAQKIE